MTTLTDYLVIILAWTVGLAWFAVLPTIGLLYTIGWMP
jgi:hypothetical protein